MFENIKDGDLVTLKLASGEEVIAKYVSGADSYISIEKALVLMQGPQGLAFGTFFLHRGTGQTYQHCQGQDNIYRLHQ